MYRRDGGKLLSRRKLQIATAKDLQLANRRYRVN